MTSIYTIGYEGSHIEDFIDVLLASDVRHILDVRDRPLSRKPGFSKTAFSLRLSQSSIAYTHVQALGDPKPGRDAMRQGRVDDFKEIFTAHLKRPEAELGLDTVTRLVADSPSALLCFECEASCCHRSLIADRIAKRTSFKIEHLNIKALAQIVGQKRGANSFAFG